MLASAYSLRGRQSKRPGRSIEGADQSWRQLEKQASMACLCISAADQVCRCISAGKATHALLTSHPAVLLAAAVPTQSSLLGWPWPQTKSRGVYMYHVSTCTLHPHPMYDVAIFLLFTHLYTRMGRAPSRYPQLSPGTPAVSGYVCMHQGGELTVL